MNSNDTLDRWLQTVSDEEAIRALTHALAVVKVRAELRQQQHVSTPSPVPAAAPPAIIEAPVDAASMRKPSLEQSLSVQLQPEPVADQSRIAVPVAEAAVEVVTAQVPVPSVVVDELQNTKTLVSALTEATEPPVAAVETDSSVASTFNRATAKTLVFDRATLGDEARAETAQPEVTPMSEPVAMASPGQTMQFGAITPALEQASAAAKTLSLPAPNALMPRRDSIEESLLVPQRNKLAVIAMLAAGALLLIGLGALVAAVLTSSEPAVVLAPKEEETATPTAAEVVAPVPAAPVAAQMTAQQSEEAVQRARAAAQSAAEAKRVAAEEGAERMAAATATTLAPAPVVEAKKVARTVAEPISAEKPAIVAVSPKAVAPAPAPVAAAPKSVAAPAPVLAAPKVVTAPAPVAPKHAAPAPAPSPAPKRGSQSSDPLDSRR